MNYKIGDAVRLKPRSRYAYQSEGTIGEIYNIAGYTLYIKWKNGHNNTYEKSDIYSLKAVKELNKENINNL